MRKLVRNAFISLFTIGSCVATYMVFEKLYNDKGNKQNQKMDNEIEIIDENDDVSI